MLLLDFLGIGNSIIVDRNGTKFIKALKPRNLTKACNPKFVKAERIEMRLSQIRSYDNVIAQDSDSTNN